MYQWALRDISIAQTVEQRYEPEYDVELMEFFGRVDYVRGRGRAIIEALTN